MIRKVLQSPRSSGVCTRVADISDDNTQGDEHIATGRYLKKKKAFPKIQEKEIFMIGEQSDFLDTEIQAGKAPAC